MNLLRCRIADMAVENTFSVQLCVSLISGSSTREGAGQATRIMVAPSMSHDTKSFGDDVE